MGKEAVGKTKSILDLLGESQKFLKTLISLGVAASEVRGLVVSIDVQ
jgi:hypothetical protein